MTDTSFTFFRLQSEGSPTKLEFWVQLIEVSCVCTESWLAFSAVGRLCFEKLYKQLPLMVFERWPGNREGACSYIEKFL